ncbi:MAG: hypothetical protein M0Z30_19845 [Actinomycetota bacterium]|nr:hypothetical protein [Actinomycetota bacterium]
MSIRHVDASDPALSGGSTPSSGESSREWWARWERLPLIDRDRPASEVLAEERSSD